MTLGGHLEAQNVSEKPIDKNIKKTSKNDTKMKPKFMKKPCKIDAGTEQLVAGRHPDFNLPGRG